MKGGLHACKEKNLKREETEVRAGLPHVLSVFWGFKKYEPERDEKRWTFL